MPSPEDGLKVFLRAKEVSIEEWLTLLEARANLLRPHLDSITLPELGRLKCLREETFEHEIGLDNPRVEGADNFSLRTQGIFRAQRYDCVERIPGTGFRGNPVFVFLDGVVRAWGLTRKGKWVLVSIHFSGQPGWKDRGYEKAEIVKIEETDIVTILMRTKEEPQQIWLELGKAVHEIVEWRKKLLWNVERLESRIEAEESAYHLLKQNIV